MEFFKINRTISYYNEESNDILTDFFSEFKTNNNIVEVEVVEDFSVSGVLTEYISAENKEELKNFVNTAECLVGECYTVFDLKGIRLLTEESSDFINDSEN